MTDRRRAIQLALDDYRDKGSTRTETIEYRGAQRSFEVITVNPEIPLLNPNNSRLRAQLATHPSGHIVKADPYTADAQGVIQELLAQTEKFDELRQQLRDFGQQDAGIISVDGLLVNGNTRLAAIRAQGIKGFDVAVLPLDATDEDFFEIEMSLQLRKLVHQDYTFTNRLLLVDSHLKRTKNKEATIQAMQWKRDGKRRLDEHQGYLQLVEEIRELNPNISYSFFDSKEELIKNLYSRYSHVSKTSPTEAENLKWTRIQALLLGLNKDEIREINENFVIEEILPTLDKDEEITEFFEKFPSPDLQSDALDEILGKSPNSPVDLKLMAAEIAKSVIDESGQVSDSRVEQSYKKLHDRYRGTARGIREARVAEEMRAEPIDYLKDVTLRIQSLADQIPILFSDDNFARGAFEYQARKTEKAIQSLQDALNRKLNT